MTFRKCEHYKQIPNRPIEHYGYCDMTMMLILRPDCPGHYQEKCPLEKEKK